MNPKQWPQTLIQCGFSKRYPRKTCWVQNGTFFGEKISMQVLWALFRLSVFVCGIQKTVPVQQGECLAHWWFDDILDNEGFLYTYNDINEWVDLSGVGVGCGDLLDIKAPPGPVPQTHFIAPNYPYSHPPPRVGFVKTRLNCTFFSVEIFVEKR